ncbi:MAG TPA: hypothetical protein VNA12_10820 [Mycobacteriales bacterium]|nr:hypothetical protein [Mycobacteriales bacterium]
MADDLTGLPQGPDEPTDAAGGQPGNPAQRAPSGPDETAEKTVAPSGPGATSEADATTEERAAREAGEYAAAVAPGVDARDAAPIPADDTAALADPEQGSSAPA